MTDNNSKILVIIPAYNEEKNIEETIKEIKEKNPSVDILVIDDGSSDRTAEIAKKQNVQVISHQKNLRIGKAVQTGLKYALIKNYKAAIQIDADGQHNPSYLPELTKQILEKKADIMIGSRFLDHDKPIKVPYIRNAGINFFSWLTTKITKQKITDCSSGFRALNKNAIKLFAENYPTEFPDAEALILANQAGLKIKEIFIPPRKRRIGHSSLNKWRFIYYPLKEALKILALCLRSNKLSKKLKNWLNLPNYDFKT